MYAWLVFLASSLPEGSVVEGYADARVESTIPWLGR